MKQMIKHSYSTPATHGMVKREALAELQYKDDIRKLHKFAQNDKLVLKPIPDRYGDRYVSYWELQLHCWVSAYFDKISRTKELDGRKVTDVQYMCPIIKGWPKLSAERYYESVREYPGLKKFLSHSFPTKKFAKEIANFKFNQNKRQLQELIATSTNPQSEKNKLYYSMLWNLRKTAFKKTRVTAMNALVVHDPKGKLDGSLIKFKAVQSVMKIVKPNEDELFDPESNLCLHVKYERSRNKSGRKTGHFNYNQSRLVRSDITPIQLHIDSAFPVRRFSDPDKNSWQHHEDYFNEVFLPRFQSQFLHGKSLESVDASLQEFVI